MSTEYRQRYFDTLLAEIDKRAPIEGLRVIGEISVETARQPHIALFAELGPARCVATTAA